MKKYIKPTARVIITQPMIMAGSLEPLDVDPEKKTDTQLSKEMNMWEWMEQE